MSKIRRLRDVSTLCLERFDVPGPPMLCELDAGHLDQGIKHKSGCTHWGRGHRAELTTPKDSEDR